MAPIPDLLDDRKEASPDRGEAIADTAWTVDAAGGVPVVSSVGAFPSVVLAAGDYTAVAKHDGKTYQTKFTVQTGADRDVEVPAQ